MFEIQETVSFEASHKIGLKNNYEGNIHTHLWHVRVTLVFKKLNEYGITLEFNEIHEKINNMIQHFDKTYLNDMEEFKDYDPTAEKTVLTIFSILSRSLNSDNCKIKKVDLWNTPNRVVSFSKLEEPWHIL